MLTANKTASANPTLTVLISPLARHKSGKKHLPDSWKSSNQMPTDIETGSSVKKMLRNCDKIQDRELAISAVDLENHAENAILIADRNYGNISRDINLGLNQLLCRAIYIRRVGQRYIPRYLLLHCDSCG